MGTPCGTSSSAPRRSPLSDRAGLCRQGYRGHDAQNPHRVFISGQKRGVFGVISVSCAVALPSSHHRAHERPKVTSAAANSRPRRRRRQLRPLGRGPQLQPHSRLAQRTFGPLPGVGMANARVSNTAQSGFLTDDALKCTLRRLNCMRNLSNMIIASILRTNEAARHRIEQRRRPADLLVIAAGKRFSSRLYQFEPARDPSTSVTSSPRLVRVRPNTSMAPLVFDIVRLRLARRPLGLEGAHALVFA